MFWYVEMNCNNASINRSFFTTLLLKFHICGAVIIAEGTGSEVNTRVDRPLALVVLALPRVCLLPSTNTNFLFYAVEMLFPQT